MVDVKEILRRWQQGQSVRSIARDGVADRKTIDRYLEAAEECGITKQTELVEAIVLQVAQLVQARDVPDPSDAWRTIAKHRARIEAWLKGEDALRLVRVHELLHREGVVVSYSTLRRFVHHEFAWKEPPITVRVDDSPPGEEAQVDFGAMGFVIDLDGKRRRLWVLIVTLTMSRYMFVWPTFVQTLLALCEGLEAAWRFFGGVVKRIVPDNMTTAIVRAHPRAPVIHRSFAEYAQSRGFFVDPARVRHPKDKARVENQVPYVRERWFAGETFSTDLVEIRMQSMIWCRDVAGGRVHGTTRRIPREVYEADERPHMLSLPAEPFDVPTWTQAKVHQDHHVQIGRALYSAPTRFVGKEVDVRADRVSVRLYFNNQLIKVHPRMAPGKRSTDPNDYPTGKAEYALRSVDGLIRRAREQGDHIGRFAEQLLAGMLPWTKMRQGYQLLRLCERYGADRVEALCARSLSFDVVDVTRIERMLKTAQTIEQSAETIGKVRRLGASRFARDAAAFATLKKSGSEPGEGGA